MNEKRTWHWYQQLKKDNPRLYHEPKTQVQMHKDASDLGASFKDGNWGKFGPSMELPGVAREQREQEARRLLEQARKLLDENNKEQEENNELDD
jgi:hypothetical protein